MSLRGKRAIRYWEGTAPGRQGDLPFDVRVRRLRRARRRLNLLRMTDSLLWLGLFAALGAVIATELFIALAKA